MLLMELGRYNFLKSSSHFQFISKFFLMRQVLMSVDSIPGDFCFGLKKNDDDWKNIPSQWDRYIRLLRRLSATERNPGTGSGCPDRYRRSHDAAQSRLSPGWAEGQRRLMFVSVTTPMNQPHTHTISTKTDGDGKFCSLSFDWRYSLVLITSSFFPLLQRAEEQEMDPVPND
jgi:hypothetical protein